jgi:hypothetical protein
LSDQRPVMVGAFKHMALKKIDAEIESGNFTPLP